MSPSVVMKWFSEWLGNLKVAVMVYSRHLPGKADKIKIIFSYGSCLPAAECPVTSKNNSRSLPLHQAGLFQTTAHRALRMGPSDM